jgi:hypothetical protein
MAHEHSRRASRTLIDISNPMSNQLLRIAVKDEDYQHPYMVTIRA